MVVAIDLETSKAPRHFPWIANSFLVLVCLYWEDGTKEHWWFNHERATDELQSHNQIREALRRSTCIVAHNAKFELVWNYLFNWGIESKATYCTQVAEYLISGQQRKMVSLSGLSEHYGIADKIDKVKMYWESGYETDEIPADILLEYCYQDCINTLAIYQRQKPIIKKQKQEALIRLNMEDIKYAAEIEFNGLYVSRQILQRHIEEFDKKIEECRKEFARLTDNAIDPGSNDQISCLLYGGSFQYTERECGYRRLKDGRISYGETARGLRCIDRKNPELKKKVDIPKIKWYTRNVSKTKELPGLGFVPPKGSETKKDGIYKTGKQIWPKLKAKTKDQKKILELLKEIAYLEKQQSTYFKGMEPKICEDDKLHPKINQTNTNTGRDTSSEPNGQNLPRGGTSPVKEYFVTRYAT